MSDSSEDRNPVEELAEEFLDRFRRGERPSLSEYTRHHPDLAEEIRELFPALVMLEDVRPAGATGTSNNPGSPTGAAGKKLERLGDYRILREVGRGGMGIVYEAEQESLGRHVALKVLSSPGLLDARHLQRFLRESKAAARLHHTNIVPVFGVGEQDGLHYYVMQFIQGQGLDQVLAVLQRLRKTPAEVADSPGVHGTERSDRSAGSPVAAGLVMEIDSVAAVAHSLLTGVFALPQRNEEKQDRETRRQGDKEKEGAAASVSLSSGLPVSLSSDPEQATLSQSGQPYWQSVARIGIQVADALSYAHGQGTLHRDIKPSNLLLDTQGIVWVTDFGLAKAADSDDLTNTGDVVGTLRYMAPERFKGHADPRSDVYALGLTLYELLTLRPAFDASQRDQLFHQVVSVNPVRPRKHNPAVPRDLETIVLKAVARDPSHRYQTAAEMAADLKRFTDDKPIRARPVSEVERMWRWCRRNPSMALLAFACMLTLVVGSAGISWKWREAESERTKVFNAEQQTARQRDEAVKARNDNRRVLAGVMLEKGIALAEQAEVGEGLFWMLEALKVVPADAGDLEVVIRTNLAAWMAQTHGLRQIIDRPRPVRRCMFTPDGRRVLTIGDGTVEIWDSAAGRLLATPIRGKNVLAISADARVILTSKREAGKPNLLERWDAGTGRPVGTPVVVAEPSNAATFVPDGSQVVAAFPDGTVRLWNTEGGAPLRSLQFDKKAIRLLAVSPDGKTLAAACQEAVPQWYEERSMPAVVYLCDLQNLEILRPPLVHSSTVHSLSFSPDSKCLVTATARGTTEIWDVRTHQRVGQAMQHGIPISTARFTPDGRTIVTGGRDGAVRWWDGATGRLLIGTLSLQKMPVTDLAFGPNDKKIVIARNEQGAGQIVICRHIRAVSRSPYKDKEPFLKADWMKNDLPMWFIRNIATFSPDASRVIVGGNHRYAGLYETARGQPVRLAAGGPFRHPWKSVGVTAYSPDGRFFATASRDATPSSDARLWNATTGQPVGPPLAHVNYVAAMAFSPDGKILVTGGYDRAVHFWDTATGLRIGSALRQVDIVISLAFSPDGKSLAVGHTKDDTGAEGVVLWDVASHRQVGQVLPDLADLLCFSPDGKQLLTAGGRRIRLWETASGRPLGEPITESGEIASVAFRPDGKMFLAGATDGTLRLRDAGSGKPIGAPMPHSARVTRVAFSPDPEGRIILAGYGDGSARLWDRATQKPLGTPVIQSTPILSVTFSPDGRSFLTVGEDGAARRWKVPGPMTDSLEKLVLRLEVLSGLAMREGQIVLPLSTSQWQRKRIQLADKEQSSEDELLVSARDRDFHDARARDAEQDGVPFAAVWHLDHLIAASTKDSEVWLAYARRARCYAAQGQYALAELDYAMAQALSSPDLLVNWYRYCTVDCLAHERWEAALWYGQRVLPTAPDDWQLYADRALAHEKLGHFEECRADLDHVIALVVDTNSLTDLATDYADRGSWDLAEALIGAACDRGPLPLYYHVWHALCCLKTGQMERYRGICANLLDRAGPNPAANVANALAWLCALGPNGVADFARPIALGERVVNQASPEFKHASLNTLGAVLYRAGCYREAIARLRESVQADRGQGSVHDWIFLAMAHHRTGDTTEARKYLEKARQFKPSKMDSPWDKIEIELLRQEAERLLE